mmetsp:Transcript_21197/g.63684  ORF Transcript_21197/g.63684 Transcript_21197/m.63684 type:complete len:208 (-) Transcript_21197:508-1131(-)
MAHMPQDADLVEEVDYPGLAVALVGLREVHPGHLYGDGGVGEVAGNDFAIPARAEDFLRLGVQLLMLDKPPLFPGDLGDPREVVAVHEGVRGSGGVWPRAAIPLRARVWGASDGISQRVAPGLGLRAGELELRLRPRGPLPDELRKGLPLVDLDGPPAEDRDAHQDDEDEECVPGGHTVGTSNHQAKSSIGDHAHHLERDEHDPPDG